MAIETERKFLVDKEKWAALEKPAPQLFRQGYLTTDPDKTIRIRIAGTQAYLTVKGATNGFSRTEIECGLPLKEAMEMLAEFAEAEISKQRYYISFGQKTWEVDEFLGHNEGLIIAELELESETETFEKPDWVLDEVTEDNRYYNSALSLHPFKNWS